MIRPSFLVLIISIPWTESRPMDLPLVDEYPLTESREGDQQDCLGRPVGAFEDAWN